MKSTLLHVRASYFLAALFLFTAALPCGALTNYVSLGPPFTTYTYYHEVDGQTHPPQSPPEYVYDHDFSTCYGSENYRHDGGKNCSVFFQALFAEPVDSEDIAYRMNAHCGCFSHYDRYREYEMVVEIKLGGTWFTLPDSYHSGWWNNEGHTSDDTGEVHFTTPMTGIEGIRSHVYTAALGTGGHGHAYADSWICELQVWGPDLTPCIHNGDVNFSGHITAQDAWLAFHISLGMITPTYEEECAADCDGDGSVTAGDAFQIFQAIFGGSCIDPIEPRKNIYR